MPRQSKSTSKRSINHLNMWTRRWSKLYGAKLSNSWSSQKPQSLKVRSCNRPKHQTQQSLRFQRRRLSRKTFSVLFNKSPDMGGESSDMLSKSCVQLSFGKQKPTVYEPKMFKAHGRKLDHIFTGHKGPCWVLHGARKYLVLPVGQERYRLSVLWPGA